MKNNRVKAAEAFARTKLKGVPLFGFPHIARVRRNAELISNGMKFNSELFEIALLLHDIGVADWIKYRNDHVKTGIALAKRFLLNNAFTSAEIDAVLHCISEHSIEGMPATAEAKILHDADLLDNIGATGIMHDSYAMGVEKWSKGKIIDYFTEVAGKLPDAFFTEKGKELAGERIVIYRDFARQLRAELV